MTNPEAETEPGQSPATDSAKNPAAPAATSQYGRVALIIAAIIAVSAIVYKATNQPDTDQPELAASGQPVNGEPSSVDEMIASLESKLQADPNNADGWRMLGWSYFETGRFAESATAMRRAIQLSPDNAEYHSMLGEALVMSGNDDNIAKDARAAFARALQLDPKDARARYFNAAAKDIDGKHEEAIEDWFALLADTPSDAPYAADIQTVIRNVGKERGIDVEKRLANAKFAPPAAKPGTGAAVATAAIPGPSSAQMQAAAGLPPGQQEAMIRSMVDGLASKLQRDPDNVDGWIMLMRSRMQLGETQKAEQALKSASAAFKSEPKKLAQVREAASALGMEGS